ncbi:MAG: hypothetical protein KKC68_04855 [Candidatus Thermoplasmatota archaeon]|nr:hypothetical protein [Candidatus Thermoplasmatota archaeon]
MNIKVMKIGCMVGCILLFVTVGSVVGISEIDTASQVKGSPLFYTQTCRFTQTASDVVSIKYVGDDSTLARFGFSEHILDNSVVRAVSLLREKPGIISRLIPLLCQHEAVQPLLKTYDISSDDLSQQIIQLQQNPDMLTDIVTYVQEHPAAMGSPLPLGLNDTNPIAILIILFALLPVFVTLVLIIATVTIVTCLNVGGCFETLFNNIVYGFINGLNPG